MTDDLEMLHWAVAQNLLTAVGSAPYVSRPTCRTRRRATRPGCTFAQLPFGEAAEQHLVYLERPEGVERADAEGFEPTGPPPPMRPEEVVPRGQDFATQGHLYRSVERRFAHLADKLGEDLLLIGPASTRPTRPPSAGLIFGLSPAWRAPTGPSSASSGKGRGTTGDWATAHYGRFLRMLGGYLACGPVGATKSRCRHWLIRIVVIFGVASNNHEAV
jgi:hypothetical protein